MLEIPDPRGDYDGAARATADAIRDGEADVIYQGVFAHEHWRGVADFLLRRPDGVYEALDTKLARTAKPAYILQLLFYNEQLARIQGREPERSTSSSAPASRRPSTRASSPPTTGASARGSSSSSPTRRRPSRTRSSTAMSATSRPSATRGGTRSTTSPASPASTGRRSRSSRPPGSRRSPQLGRAPAEPVPAGINPDTWAKNREQAELQLHARETGEDIYRLLPQQPEAGFALLPEPSPGDLFFDFEGNPFWDKDGSLEYLWGILDVDGNFTPLHAHDHDTERQAFEQFIDLVHARLREYPDLHVYHYAAYEITALKRLMGRYGTREAELDDLLRRGVFVDLLKVVRNGLRTSRPGYGLKEMEAFLDFERQAEVKDGGTSIVIFEQWMQTGEQALLDQIDEYNREDCIATRLLRDWLLELHEPLARSGRSRPPAPPEPRPVPEAKAGAGRAARGAARGGGGAGGAAARLPRPRAQAGLVGLLRPDGADARGAARRPGGDQRSRAGRRAGARRPFLGLHARLPAAGAQARRGPADGRSCNAEVAGLDHRARPRIASARAQARPLVRGRAAARGDRPEDRLQHAGAGGGADAVRPLAPRRRPPLPRTRVDPAARAVRPARADERPRRDEGARPGAGRSPPRHPGPARLGQDLDVRSPDRAPAREREDGRRRLHQPQGDPQPARRRGRGGRRDRDLASTGARRRAPATRSRTTTRPGSRTSITRTSASAPTSRPGRRGSSRARTRRSTTSSSTRPGRCRSPTRSRWGRRRGTSSSSATRSSSTR